MKSTEKCDFRDESERFIKNAMLKPRPDEDQRVNDVVNEYNYLILFK